jgi:methionyl-tRNA synthetase
VPYGAGFGADRRTHFLTVDGQKMSKSRGTFITARRYLDLLPPEPLRYYFAGKLGNGLDDIDLNLEDFIARVNSDIVGKLVNIASRCAPFVERGGGRLADRLPDPALYAGFSAAAEPIAALYESRDYAGALREVMALADRANQYVDQQKPWVLAKDPARRDDALEVATQGINLFRVLMTYLAPVLPGIAARASEWLEPGAVASWDAVRQPLLGCPIGKPRSLPSASIRQSRQPRRHRPEPALRRTRKKTRDQYRRFREADRAPPALEATRVVPTSCRS